MVDQVSLKPSEISELIKERIKHFDLVSEVSNEGTIVSLKDGIVRIHGLADVQQGEMITQEIKIGKISPKELEIQGPNSKIWKFSLEGGEE